MHNYKMEHLFSYTGNLDPNVEIIGPTPEGIKANLYITGGEVTGPKVTGVLRPVGADWLTIRSDGVASLDVRTTIETNDGALIYLTYTGVADLGEDGYQQFVQGTAATRFPIHAVAKMITSHPDYLWVNRLQCINIGEGNLEESFASYDLYAIRS